MVPSIKRGKKLHADYIFESDYQLESIEDHAEFMWSNKHLKAVPRTKVDENGMGIVEVGAHRQGIVEELKKAHIYIERLHQRLNALGRSWRAWKWASIAARNGTDAFFRIEFIVAALGL